MIENKIKTKLNYRYNKRIHNNITYILYTYYYNKKY